MSPAVFPLVDIPPEKAAPGFGPEMVIVVAFAALEAESVMLLPPASTIRVPELIPVSPAVFPMLESATFRIPCVCTLCVTPLSVTVVAPAAVPWDAVIPLVPTITKREPVLTVVFPRVFPPVETPTESTPCVCTVCVPEIEMVDAPAAVACESEMSPSPTNTMREPVLTVVLPAVFPPVETPALRIPWV